MAGAPAPFGPRPRDTKVMVAVTYGDGRSAYIRVDPETARHHGRDGDRAETAGGWRDPGRRDRQRQASPVKGPRQGFITGTEASLKRLKCLVKLCRSGRGLPGMRGLGPEGPE